MPRQHTATFDYDAYKKFRNASERGYSTLREKYSRPGRAEKFLRKRLNERIDVVGYHPGMIYEFTVKAPKYKIFALILPYDDGIIPQFPTIMRADKHRQYRFADTLEEVLHIRAMRQLDDMEPRDLGHLKAKTI